MIHAHGAPVPSFHHASGRVTQRLRRIRRRIQTQRRQDRRGVHGVHGQLGKGLVKVKCEKGDHGIYRGFIVVYIDFIAVYRLFIVI